MVEVGFKRGRLRGVLYFDAVAGRPECLGIEIRSGLPLTTTALRDLNLHDLIERKRSDAGRLLAIPVHHERTITDAMGLTDEVGADRTARRGRPPKYPREHFIWLASLYLDAKRMGEKVYPYLMKKTGIKSKHTLSKQIGTAARMGLLEERPGRGQLRGKGKR